jgi:hypothetical protein
MYIDQSIPFIKKLNNSKTKKSKLELIKKELKDLNVRAGTISSLKAYLTKYRNLFKEKFKDNQVLLGVLLKNFRLNDKQRDTFKSDTEVQIFQDQNNLREIKNIEKIISISKSLLNSPSIYKKVIGLSLLTGRRTAEIGTSAEFKIYRKKKDVIHFFGQLKTKDSREDKGVVIPVLHDPEELINALEIIRNKKPQWIGQPKKFNSSSSKGINEVVRNIYLGLIEGKVRTKDLRAIYAEICFSRNENNRISKNAFFANILGHSENDLTTCNSYIDFFIKKG